MVYHLGAGWCIIWGQVGVSFGGRLVSGFGAGFEDYLEFLLVLI